MRKTFSVITINYNNLNGLKRTFRSIVCQTAREHVQFIVIDGASNDGSALFLTDNSLLIDSLEIAADNGIYDAMNKGLKLAEGDYVWFVNSGDAIQDPHLVEKLLPLVKPDVGVIFGDTMFIDEDGKDVGLISKLKPQPLPNKLHSKSFRFGMNVCHQSFIAKRDLCEPYDLTFKQAADIDWIIKILKKNPLSARYDGVIAAFEIGGSSSQNEKTAWKERYEVLSKHYGYLPNLFAHGWIAIRRLLFRMKIWRP